jgi:hypothetical protein
MIFTLSLHALLSALKPTPSTLAVAFALPGLATLGLIRGLRRGPGGVLRLSPAPHAPARAFHDVRPLLESELARARRYERPCSLLVLRFAGKIEPASLRHAGQVLERSIRENDIACFEEAAGRFVIALPECEHEAAAAAGERLRTLLRQRTATDFVAGCATFPFEALILEDLVEAAATSHRRPLPVTTAGLQPLVGGARLRAQPQRQEP